MYRYINTKQPTNSFKYSLVDTEILKFTQNKKGIQIASLLII